MMQAVLYINFFFNIISAIASIVTGTVTVSHSLGENNSTSVPATAIVCAHGKDTDQHDPAALQVNIFILCISMRRDS